MTLPRSPSLYDLSVDEFDYVVVGGGSAGCVVASRLSEDPSVTVCLLEAGGEGRDVLIRAPLGFAAAMPRGMASSRGDGCSVRVVGPPVGA
jgi:choline dehydrogenase-like flavoprotein